MVSQGLDAPLDESIAEAPMHGFRGDGPEDGDSAHPRGFTVAISREAGSRGSTIARKLGELLGWQVYDQELFDYLLGDETGRARLLGEIPAYARDWAERQLDKLRHDQRITVDDDSERLLQLSLAVAARGNAILVGRGVGYLLPAATSLHVRIIAPFEDRVSYVAEMLRLARPEAAAEVRDRDDRRAKFLNCTVRQDPGDLTAYDFVVNSSRLGIEAAAQTIACAVRGKRQSDEYSEPIPDDPMGLDDVGIHAIH